MEASHQDGGPGWQPGGGGGDSACGGGGGEPEAVKVVVRVRPPEEAGAATSCVEVDGHDGITVRSGYDATSSQFSWVAGPATTQADFFRVVGRPVLEGCLGGYNCSILAYGQAGSGKTHTMLGQLPEPGSDELPADAGLAPRMLHHLWRRMPEVQASMAVQQASGGEDAGARPCITWLVRCSVLEVCREELRDLLSPGAAPLRLREEIRRGVFVEGLTERVVDSARDALQVLRAGLAARASSGGSELHTPPAGRGHCVVTLRVESRFEPGPGLPASVRSSQLQLVDLAGSERARSGAGAGTGEEQLLQDASGVNGGLAALGLVVLKLAEQQEGAAGGGAGELSGLSRRHVPYGSSKLTSLLRDSFGGTTKTTLVATVSPSPACLAETLCTLGFASHARKVVNKALVNEDTVGDAALRADNLRLRQELLVARGRASWEGPVQSAAAMAVAAGGVAPQAQLAEQAAQLQQAMQLLAELGERNSQLEEALEYSKRERSELERSCLDGRQELAAIQTSLKATMKDAKSWKQRFQLFHRKGKGSGSKGATQPSTPTSPAASVLSVGLLSPASSVAPAGSQPGTPLSLPDSAFRGLFSSPLAAQAAAVPAAAEAAALAGPLASPTPAPPDKAAEAADPQAPVAAAAGGRVPKAAFVPVELHRQLLEERQLTAQLSEQVRKLQQQLALACDRKGSSGVSSSVAGRLAPPELRTSSESSLRRASLVAAQAAPEGGEQARPTATAAVQAAPPEQAAGGRGGEQQQEQAPDQPAPVVLQLRVGAYEGPAAKADAPPGLVAALQLQVAALQEQLEAVKRERTGLAGRLASARSVLAAARNSTPGGCTPGRLPSPQPCASPLVEPCGVCADGDEAEGGAGWPTDPGSPRTPGTQPGTGGVGRGASTVDDELMAQEELCRQHHEEWAAHQRHVHPRHQLTRAVHAAIVASGPEEGAGGPPADDQPAPPLAGGPPCGGESALGRLERQVQRLLEPGRPSSASARNGSAGRRGGGGSGSGKRQSLRASLGGLSRTYRLQLEQGAEAQLLVQQDGEPQEEEPQEQGEEDGAGDLHSSCAGLLMARAPPGSPGAASACERATPGSARSSRRTPGRPSALAAGAAAAGSEAGASGDAGRGSPASWRLPAPAWNAEQYEDEAWQLQEQLQELLSANSGLKAALQQRDAEVAAQQARLEQQGHELACCESMLQEMHERLAAGEAAAAAAAAEHCDAVWAKGQVAGLLEYNEALQEQLELRGLELEQLKAELERFMRGEGPSKGRGAAAAQGQEGAEAAAEDSEERAPAAVEEGPGSADAGPACGAGNVEAHDEAEEGQQQQQQQGTSASGPSSHPAPSAPHEGAEGGAAGTGAHGARRSRRAAGARPSAAKQLRLQTSQLTAQPSNPDVAAEQAALLHQQLEAVGLQLQQKQLEAKLNAVRVQMDRLARHQAAQIRQQAVQLHLYRAQQQHGGQGPQPHEQQAEAHAALPPLSPPQKQQLLRRCFSSGGIPGSTWGEGGGGETAARRAATTGGARQQPWRRSVLSESAGILAGQQADIVASAAHAAERPAGSGCSSVTCSRSSSSSSSLGSCQELLFDLLGQLQVLAHESHQASSFKATSASTLTPFDVAGGAVEQKGQQRGGGGGSGGAAWPSDAAVQLQMRLQVSSALELEATRGLLHAGAAVMELQQVLGTSSADKRARRQQKQQQPAAAEALDGEQQSPPLARSLLGTFDSAEQQDSETAAEAAAAPVAGGGSIAAAMASAQQAQSAAGEQSEQQHQERWLLILDHLEQQQQRILQVLSANASARAAQELQEQHPGAPISGVRELEQQEGEVGQRQVGGTEEEQQRQQQQQEEEEEEETKAVQEASEQQQTASGVQPPGPEAEQGPQPADGSPTLPASRSGSVSRARQSGSSVARLRASACPLPAAELAELERVQQQLMAQISEAKEVLSSAASSRQQTPWQSQDPAPSWGAVAAGHQQNGNKQHGACGRPRGAVAAAAAAIEAAANVGSASPLRRSAQLARRRSDGLRQSQEADAGGGGGGGSDGDQHSLRDSCKGGRQQQLLLLRASSSGKLGTADAGQGQEGAAEPPPPLRPPLLSSSSAASAESAELVQLRGEVVKLQLQLQQLQVRAQVAEDLRHRALASMPRGHSGAGAASPAAPRSSAGGAAPQRPPLLPAGLFSPRRPADASSGGSAGGAAPGGGPSQAALLLASTNKTRELQARCMSQMRAIRQLEDQVARQDMLLRQAALAAAPGGAGAAAAGTPRGARGAVQGSGSCCSTPRGSGGGAMGALLFSPRPVTTGGSSGGRLLPPAFGGAPLAIAAAASEPGSPPAKTPALRGSPLSAPLGATPWRSGGLVVPPLSGLFSPRPLDAAAPAAAAAAPMAQRLHAASPGGARGGSLAGSLQQARQQQQQQRSSAAGGGKRSSSGGGSAAAATTKGVRVAAPGGGGSRLRVAALIRAHLRPQRRQSPV